MVEHEEHVSVAVDLVCELGAQQDGSEEGGD